MARHAAQGAARARTGRLIERSRPVKAHYGRLPAGGGQRGVAPDTIDSQRRSGEGKGLCCYRPTPTGSVPQPSLHPQNQRSVPSSLSSHRSFYLMALCLQLSSLGGRECLGDRRKNSAGTQIPHRFQDNHRMRQCQQPSAIRQQRIGAKRATGAGDRARAGGGSDPACHRRRRPRASIELPACRRCCTKARRALTLINSAAAPSSGARAAGPLASPPLTGGSTQT